MLSDSSTPQNGSGSPAKLTLHLGDPPGEIGQHTFDVADVDLLLLEVLLQF